MTKIELSALEEVTSNNALHLPPGSFAARFLSRLYNISTHTSDPNMSAVNLKDKLALFSEHWSPRIVADYNGNDVMVVKVKGEFNWHSHPDTDDFFLVIKGQVTIKLRDRDVHLREGELFVVPKGVEHCPVAVDEAELLIIEPHGTPNTGDQATAVTKIEI